MTYNLKLSHKSVKFAYANRSTTISLNSTTVYSNVQYPLTSMSGSIGLQASLSGGDIVLGDRVYHGFFYPSAGGANQFSMRILINGLELSTQRTINKPSNSSVPSSITRAFPLFFSYNAIAGDLLSIRYSKDSGAVFDIYSGAIGTNLFLWEVER